MSSGSFYCRVPSDWWADPSLCLFEWQTLIGGALAVAAAVLGAIFLRKQIKQADGLYKGQLWRRHNAVRSTLPLALAAISITVVEIVESVATSLESLDEPDFNTAFEDATREDEQLRNFPEISAPTAAIDAISAFVETLSNKIDVRHIAELLSSVQVLLARYNSFSFKKMGVTDDLYRLMIDSAKVLLLNDSLYNYGRFVEEESFAIVGVVPESEAWDKIYGKAQGAVFRRRNPDFFFRRLRELIERYKRSEISPWNEKFEP